MAAVLMTGSVAAAETGHVVARFSDFGASKGEANAAPGWKTWSPRPEIRPLFWIAPAEGRHGRGALVIKGRTAAAYGAWKHAVDGIEAGKTYRFTAWYRTTNVRYERRSVSARLVFLDEKGQQARPPDYVDISGREGEWTRVEHTCQAPEGTRGVSIELALMWAPDGTVQWDDIQLAEEPSPRQRVVRAATVFYRPRGTHSPEENLGLFGAQVEALGSQKPDIVCLPEGITVVGTDKSYAEVSEPVPGPSTARLGALAKKLHTYIVAGLYERAGDVVYNTAVLIGRDGELVGKYRKTHLPREEVEGGITPGDSYPVFKTDFGTVGLLICWDVQFPEPARAMALQGAEMILLPIWGGSDVLARARAMENHVFLVTSSYDMQTFIVNPAGEVLAEASGSQRTALAELHLDRKIVQPWLGDMKARTWKERRPDIPVEPGQDRKAEAGR